MFFKGTNFSSTLESFGNDKELFSISEQKMKKYIFYFTTKKMLMIQKLF